MNLARMLPLAAGIAASACLAGAFRPTPTAFLSPTEPASERDVTYATRTTGDAKSDLKLNIVIPKAKPGQTGPFPCVVCIHGGGWQAGRREDLDQLTAYLSERGYVAATISYRFAPAHQHPAQIEDCAEAVRFLIANAAKYTIDPARIGAVGFSAGAHLAMLLAVGDPGDKLGMEHPANRPDGPTGKVAAAVSYFGPTQLDAADLPEVSVGIVSNLIGNDPAGREARCRAASPITYLNKGDSPILLFNGTADPLVPHTQAFTMIEAMTKANIPGRIEIVAGAGHGFAGSELLRTLEATVKFFDEHLAAKPTTPAKP